MKLRFVLALVAVLLLPAARAGAVTVERVVGDSGVVAWLVRDHSNPIIAVELAFMGSAALDPPGKEGLAHMVASLIDEGSGDLESYAFQKKLEDLAIGLSFSANEDTFHGSLKTLSENRDTAFEMLRMAMTRPRFDEEPVDRIRSQILAGLARDLQNPNVIAQRAWYKTVFPNHPYGTPVNGTPDSIKAIALEDLKSFPGRRFGRDRMYLAVVGDITPEQLKPLLDSTFGVLPAMAEAFTIPEVTPLTGKTQVIKQVIPQSVALFGEQGLKRADSDWFPAYVVNYILGGGGFSSRLMEQVREKRGLAYSVYSYLVPFKHGAILSGGVATENSRMKDSLDIIRAQWKRMAEEGPSEEELKNAKTYLTGSYPLQLDSTSSIASILVAIQIDNLGIDYLDRRNKLVDAVTLDDARRVAKRLLDPAKLTVVVVGDPQGLEPTAPETPKGAEGKSPENKTVEGRAPTLPPPLGQ